MKTRNSIIGVAALGCSVIFAAIEVSAQEPVLRENRSRIELNDGLAIGLGQTSPSDLRRHAPTAMEIRQQRALYLMNQRIARMATNEWMGYSPLRPFISNSDYYPQRRVYYVPYYLR